MATLGPEHVEWQWAIRDLPDLFSDMPARRWWALVTLKDPIHHYHHHLPEQPHWGRGSINQKAVSTLGSDTKCLCKPFTFPPSLLTARQGIWTRRSCSRWTSTFWILGSFEISSACCGHSSQRKAQTPQVWCTLLRASSNLPELPLNLLSIHKPQVNNPWARQILIRHF